MKKESKIIDEFEFGKIIPLSTHIQKSRKRKKPLSQKYLDRFKLEGICADKSTKSHLCDKASRWQHGTPNNNNLVYNMVLTGKYGLILTFDNEPQTLLGFNLIGNYMEILQNKGIRPLYFGGRRDNTYFKGDSVGLRQIRNNTELMYKIAINIARKINLDSVEIISAKNRDDFNYNDTLSEKIRWQIFKTFEVTPHNMGFKENQEQNWKLFLSNKSTHY